MKIEIVCLFLGLVFAGLVSGDTTFSGSDKLSEEIEVFVEISDVVCNGVRGEECEEFYEFPRQLFDIRMDLEDTSIDSSGELVAVVTYESFGSVPTPVDLTFEIFDLSPGDDSGESAGDLLYSKNGSVVVSTEEVTRTRFLDLYLEDGEYEFVFTTLYNVDVRDEFRQRFVVGEKSFFARVWDWIRFWS